MTDRGKKLIVININEMTWGDAIGKVWVYQYLSEKIRSSKMDDVDIWMNDQWGVCKWIQLPEPRVRFNEYESYYQVLTHHRHWWCYLDMNNILNQDIYYRGINGQILQVKGSQRIWKPMFWDISGIFMRFHIEKWSPPFLITSYLKNLFQGVLVSYNLTSYFDNFEKIGDWMVFHFHNNFPDLFDRTAVNLKEFSKSWKDQRVIEFVQSKTQSTGGIILATDAMLTAGMFQAMNLGSLGARIINLGSINPWVKLYLMKLAGKGKVFGFHSGFTSLCGCCEVVNLNSHSAVMTGPPIVSYSNGMTKINSGHYRDVCLHANLNWDLEKYSNWVCSDQSLRYFMYHGLYETLQFQEWKSSNLDCGLDQDLDQDLDQELDQDLDQELDQELDKVCLEISFTRENCLVPYDTEFGIRDQNALRTILPNHEYLWGSDFMQYNMRRFPLLIENLMGIPFKYYIEIKEMMIENQNDGSQGVCRYFDEGG